MLGPFPAPPRWAPDSTWILSDGPSPNTEATKSLPRSWECPEPTCPLAAFPHSHPPERDVHTHLHFLLPSSFLSPWPPRANSEAGLCSTVSPLLGFSSLLSPRPSCLPWQVPLSAWVKSSPPRVAEGCTWVRVLPQEQQKVWGAGTWALTSDTRGTRGFLAYQLGGLGQFLLPPCPGLLSCQVGRTTQR